MLVGRTFSYSDTQRYRVGPNYLQLPVNQPKNAKVATNQRDGAMTYHVDGAGTNPSINYEPSILGRLSEAPKPSHDEQGPEIRGRITRARIPRTNDYKQAGERYLNSEQWERDELVANLIDGLSQCDRPIQERMVWHLLMVEDELGLRVGRGHRHLGRRRASPRAPADADAERRGAPAPRHLGSNGTREVTDKVMTHCVPNERVAVADETDLIAS